MEKVLQDLRYAVRRLSRRPGFVLVSALCIAMGVAAATTIFSLANAMLLRPVPGLTDPGNLVEIGRADGDFADTLPYPTWRDVREGAETVEVALYTSGSFALGGQTEPEVRLGYAVTGNYFEVLGVGASVGRLFDPAETPVSGPAEVAVVSQELFQRRWAGDPAVIGTTIRVNNRPVTLIGVTDDGFRGHVSLLPADVWVPLGLAAPGLPSQQDLAGERNHFLLGIGRLAAGISPAEASAELNGRLVSMVETRPFLEDVSVLVQPLKTLPGFAYSMAQFFVTVLMGVVGLVLLIACTNVASMLLARGWSRTRELAVRQALGAGRRRLLQQLLTETVLLFVAGGAAGLLLSLWTTRALSALQPPSPPPYVLSFDLGLDQRVLLFALAVTLATSLIFGLGPALRATRFSLVPSLKNEGPTGGYRRSRFRALLIAGQMAMTLLLLIAAGLFVKALGKARAIDPGFDPRGVAVVSLDLQLHGYEEASGQQAHRQLQLAAAELPGVTGAGLTMRLPLGFPANTSFGGVNVEGFEAPSGDTSWPAPVNIVSPGYFDALQLPLVAGRDFEPSDDADREPVAIVNELMARHFFPDGALGRRFFEGQPGNGVTLRIIGVVRDSKYATLDEEPTFFYYLPLAQRYRSEMSLLVRGADPAGPSIAAIRSALGAVDPGLPFLEIVQLDDYVAITYLPQRVAGLVTGLLGSVGLLLGAVGIAGVAASMARQRHHEMGIRLALGAGKRQVTRLFVRQGMIAPLAGALAGLGGAVITTHLLSGLLFGVAPLDAATIAAVTVLLLAVAALANWLPVRRALRRDPLEVLKYE